MTSNVNCKLSSEEETQLREEIRKYCSTSQCEAEERRYQELAARALAELSLRLYERYSQIARIYTDELQRMDDCN